MKKIKKILILLILFGISTPERSSNEIQTDINNRNLELKRIKEEIKDVKTEIVSKIIIY